MCERVTAFYSREPFKYELKKFERIIKYDISKISEADISSDSFIINTLQASLWCILKNSSYVDTILTAVNLGGDTDTIASIAGGIAGVYYGIDSITKKWIDKIPRKEDIEKLAERFYKSIR